MLLALRLKHHDAPSVGHRPLFAWRASGLVGVESTLSERCLARPGASSQLKRQGRRGLHGSRVVVAKTNSMSAKLPLSGTRAPSCCTIVTSRHAARVSSHRAATRRAGPRRQAGTLAAPDHDYGR